ncbi:MAG: TIGR03619 family F420-dependent LLM class oxidoreductase [Tepidiformaceae bacterium]
MSIGIGLGIAGFPFSDAQAFLKWIDLCETSGVDSVWFSERLVSMSPALEPIVTFGLVAGRTERLKFGMNAIVLPLRDPLVLAKQCATLDFLSGGRLLPAFGVGSDTSPEFRSTGRKPAGRGQRSDEMIQIMSRLWSEEHVSFEGKHFQYEDVTISPRPVQQPLPVWIGGSSDAAVRRTATLGTGWLGGVQTPAQVAPVIRKIRAATAEAGRTIDDDHYGAGFPFRFGSFDEPVVERNARAYSRVGEGLDPREYMGVGGADEIGVRAEEYIAAGVSKFVLRPIADSDAEMMAQTRQLVEEVVPRFRGR